MEFKIVHLYPELLNHYGDLGNILSLKKRLEERGISATVKTYSANDTPDFDDADIVYIGGGNDKAFMLAYKALLSHKEALRKYVEADGVALAVCNGFEMLGNSFVLGGETYEGFGILDITTKGSGSRIAGNIIVESSELGFNIVGFENHMGVVNSSGHTPLGTVLFGRGNDNGSEGVIYKKLIGTYIHGPLLPKNPHLADHIIKNAMQKKYGECELSLLDDTLENNAHNYIIKKYLNK